MIRVGRPILYAHCLLLSASIVAGESALSQTFVRPQIPEGQTIGDIGASNSGAGNSVSGSFVPNSSAADSVSGINVRDVPGFDPGTDGSVEDSETMIFGPVDGDFPAGAISARDSSVPSLPPEFNQPARADRSVVTDDFSGGSGSFGRSDVTGVSPVPTMRETSARGRRADIDEMPGREIIRQRYQDGKVQIARHVKQDENAATIDNKICPTNEDTQ